jgi:hypothetical protein
VQSKPVRLDPFAASPLQLNPPTFRWPAKDDEGTVFRLEFSRDATFKDARTEIVSDLFFRPLEPFAPGQWYWRVRADGPAAKDWVGPESFTISSDLPRWPIAPWSDWVARLPDSHPRIYLRAADLPAFKENARRLGPGLERWREKTRKRLLEPFSLESFESQVADDVDPLGPESQERKKRVWASKAASIAASQPAVDGAWLWLATGEPWLLEAVRKRAALVASFDPAGFITDGNTGRDRANVDFGNALLVHDLAVIYDLLYAELTSGRATGDPRRHCRPRHPDLRQNAPRPARAHARPRVATRVLRRDGRCAGRRPRGGGRPSVGRARPQVLCRDVPVVRR